MFSSTLRKKPVWTKLGPALASTALAPFRESPMTSFDLSIPVTLMQKQLTVRVILLDTIEVWNGEAASRLQSLSSAVRPANAMDVVMLVHDASKVNLGLQSMIQFQTLLLDHTSIVSLPVSSAEKILPALESLVSKIKESFIERPARRSVSAQLIAHATTSAPIRPLSHDQAHVLSRLFPSIQELEKGTRTAEGQARIRSYLDAATARDIIDFWEDEWVM